MFEPTTSRSSNAHASAGRGRWRGHGRVSVMMAKPRLEPGGNHRGGNEKYDDAQREEDGDFDHVREKQPETHETEHRGETEFQILEAVDHVGQEEVERAHAEHGANVRGEHDERIAR